MLVDVFYVLDGRRALAAAAASAVVLLVSGVASGYTFGKLSASKA